MRRSFLFLILSYTLIVILLFYAFFENENSKQVVKQAWSQYEVSFKKLTYISIMLNHMQNLTSIYSASTITDDEFELDDLIIQASLNRSGYIEHYLKMEQLPLDKTEREHLDNINEHAGKVRLAQLAYDDVIITGELSSEQRFKLLFDSFIVQQRYTQDLMRDFLNYIRDGTIANSEIFHEQTRKENQNFRHLQVSIILLAIFILLFSLAVVHRSQEDTEAKQQDLMKAEGFLNSILLSSPVALLITDDHGMIIKTNKNAERLFGYPNAVLTQSNISMLIPECFRSQHEQLFNDYVKQPYLREMSPNVEISALRNTGEVFPVEIGISPILDQEKLFLACSVKDISEQKRMQQEIIDNKNRAEEANMAKSEFLASVSHELRSPLHAILSFSRLGKKITQNHSLQPQKIKKLNNHYNRILISGQRLLGYINNLLDSAKFEAGKLEMNFDNNDLGKIIDSVLSEQEIRIQESGLMTYYTAKNYHKSAQFDKENIAQVVLNLVSNAIKHSPANGSLYLSLESVKWSLDPDEKQLHPVLHFSIMDEGEGIPEGQLESIFERFAQSSTKVSGGTGLGLSICREIILAHNGSIWAENTPDKGALFQFIIPEYQKTFDAKNLNSDQ
jgi:PAS domain S-box-containing protein